MLCVKVTDTDNCISLADGTITPDCNIVTDSHVLVGGDTKRQPSPLCVVCMCVSVCVCVCVWRWAGAIHLKITGRLKLKLVTLQPASSLWLTH